MPRRTAGNGRCLRRSLIVGVVLCGLAKLLDGPVGGLSLGVVLARNSRCRLTEQDFCNPPDSRKRSSELGYFVFVAVAHSRAGLPRPEIEDAGGAATVRSRHNPPIPPVVDLAAGFEAAVDGASVLTNGRARLSPFSIARTGRWRYAGFMCGWCRKRTFGEYGRIGLS